MSLVKTGGGITDIRGGFGGVYFTRDRSGLHCSPKPRRVHQITDAQRAQRNAFSAARRYSTDNRTVSYLMYRYMNGLPLALPVGWSSPSSHFDPGANKWAFPERAYDDDEVSWSYNSCVNSGHYLNLIHSKIITCPKIRIMARQKSGCEGGGEISDPNVTVDIYSASAWQNLHTGLITLDVWVIINCPSPLLTNAVRVKDNTPAERFYLKEVDFWAIPEPPHYPVPTDYQIPKL